MVTLGASTFCAFNFQVYYFINWQSSALSFVFLPPVRVDDKHSLPIYHVNSSNIFILESATWCGRIQGRYL